MALVDASDRVVLGDTLQYSRQSYQNRTPVRTPQGSQWLSVPLEGRQHGRAICDVEIHGRVHWMRKHRRSLHYNYRTTPFFDLFEPDLAPILDGNWERLGALTCTSVEVMARLLHINTKLVRASRLDGRPEDLGIMLDRSGGGSVISEAETADADRHLLNVRHVLHLDDLHYRQNFEGFEGGMSALDLLFNYGPEALSMLRRGCHIESPAWKKG